MKVCYYARNIFRSGCTWPQNGSECFCHNSFSCCKSHLILIVQTLPLHCFKFKSDIKPWIGVNVLVPLLDFLRPPCGTWHKLNSDTVIKQWIMSMSHCNSYFTESLCTHWAKDTFHLSAFYFPSEYIHWSFCLLLHIKPCSLSIVCIVYSQTCYSEY